VNRSDEKFGTALRRSILGLVVTMLIASVLYGQTGQTTSPAAPSSQATPDKSDSATAKAHDDTYIIGEDDVLSINVWKEAEISRSVPVRSDGKISLPLVGEVQAAGNTPMKLEQDITAKLKSYIAEPEVTVIVQQANSQKFNILGMVNKPGLYAITSSPTVLDAIAMAGGFRDFAKQKSIYVLRENSNGTRMRIPFNYKEVVQGKNPEQNIKLQPHDTVVVP